MRWDDLFADLEGEAEALERAELAAEVAERTRAEIAQVTLLARLRSCRGQSVDLRLVGGVELSGIVTRAGDSWILLANPNEVLVPMTSVLAVRDLGLDAVGPTGVGPVESRLTLASVLRALAVDRAPVTAVLADASTVTGTPERVGRDFLDLAVHGLGDAPRAGAVRHRTTVPYSALAMVVRAASPWD